MKRIAFAAIGLVLAAPVQAQICQTNPYTGYTHCSNGAWQQSRPNGSFFGGDNYGNRWNGESYSNGTTFYHNQNICRLTGDC